MPRSYFTSEESILVPFLLLYPEKFGNSGRTVEIPLGAPDIMPTLLSLCGLEIPRTVEGMDMSKALITDSVERAMDAL